MEKSKQTIYQRLNSVRVELQKMNLKKSGRNAFAGFDYYELCDFVPAINLLCARHDLTTAFGVEGNQCSLFIIDSVMPDNAVKFVMPFEQPSIKGANAVQNLGGAITYLRRYLFMTAFEIVESDISDATIGKDEKKDSAKPVVKQEPKKDANVDKIKIEINRAVAKKMKEIGEERFKEIMNQEEITSLDIKETNDLNWLKSVLNVIQTIN